MNDTSSSCEKSTPKHVVLDVAIKQINDITTHCNQLLQQINDSTDENLEATVPVSRTPPSLRQILEDGPERIKQECSEAHKVIESIHNAIF